MDKKFMNKLDDMELDMVAGGGFFDTLKEVTKKIVKPVEKTTKELIKVNLDGKGYDKVKKLFDKLYKWVLPPQCG